MDLDSLNVRAFWEDAVAEVPEHPFLIWEDQPISYLEFDDRANRAATVWSEAGVGKGDPVVFMVGNSPGFLAAWFGLIKIGAVISAINTGFKHDEVAYQLRHSDPVAVLVDAAHADVAGPIAEGMNRRVFHLGPHPVYQDFLAAATAITPDVPDVDLNGADLLSLIYTSGTTGPAKGVMQTHRNFVLTGHGYPYWLDIRHGDRLYVCMPYFHINSQAYSTMGAIGARATIVLSPKFSASRFWPEVRRHRVTHFNFVGAMTAILSRREPDPEDGDNVVRIAYGGTKLPRGMQSDVEQRFGLKVISGFGMSETTFGMVEDIAGERRPGSIGKPRQHPDPTVPRNEARLIDDDGNDVPEGEIGELLLRNPAMASGYFRDAKKSAETFRDGWLHTGDLLRRDEDGFYFFVDRKKDIIRRRGENISSGEVERTLAAHPDVAHAAVVAVPSELLDDEVLACLIPRPNRTIDPETLLEWAAERLALFKVPRYVRIVSEFPRTGSHKVRKEQLRADWRDSDLYDRERAAQAAGER